MLSNPGGRRSSAPVSEERLDDLPWQRFSTFLNPEDSRLPAPLRVPKGAVERLPLELRNMILGCQRRSSGRSLAGPGERLCLEREYVQRPRSRMAPGDPPEGAR